MCEKLDQIICGGKKVIKDIFEATGENNVDGIR